MSGFAVSHTIKNVDSLVNKINKLTTDALASQIKAVQESIFLIQETAIKSIQDNSSGTPTVRFNPKRTILVSKPGDPPNTDTGRLVQSINFDFSNGGLTGRVGTNLKYGAALEFGTKKMEARPWLAPAIVVASGVIADIFAKAIRDTIREATR